ncbi:hypothetical protein [Pandoraea sp. NPDC087047]|uniref:hypothetical protein n=1 Tax=Pandoraea sp. NPDC087047 TaxID=3364390 RepID=UPI00381725C6
MEAEGPLQVGTSRRAKGKHRPVTVDRERLLEVLHLTDMASMHELVLRLYQGNWDDSLKVAVGLVDNAGAVDAVRELVTSRGWRERVAAAKVISAFHLVEFVAPLIQTFVAEPETYTAKAFAYMLVSVKTHERDQLLAVLRSACPGTDYGHHLLDTIDKALNEAKADDR